MDKFNDACLVIANDGRAYHPVTNNNYTVTIKLPSNLINYADPKRRKFGEQAKSAADGDESILTLKVANDSFDEPSLSQSSLDYSKGNLTIRFPGRMEATSGTASFHVFVTKSAYDLLYSWKMASGNILTGEVGDPDDYWAEVQIDITTGNKGTLVGSWVLHNVWCRSLQGVKFSASGNEQRTVQITLEYFRPEYKNGTYEEA